MGNNLPPEAYTPAYVPVIQFTGGRQNSAPHTPVEHGTANATNDYMPRTQADKAAQLGLNYAQPINTPFGSIQPQDPYPKEGDTPPADPVITSLDPATAVVGTPPLTCVITGTGFTPYSVVETGNYYTDLSAYISPTELRIVIDPVRSVAGIIDVKVLDHNIKSAAAEFEFTAAAP